MPLSYKPRIQAISGVRTVAIWTWFGGVHRDIKELFPSFAVESEDYFRIYPEIFELIEGMEIGRSLKLQRRDWKVVGVFDANGSGFESEIWGDVDVINRGSYHSVTLRMRDPSMISAFNSELEHNPPMQVRAVQERKYLPSGSARHRSWWEWGSRF